MTSAELLDMQDRCARASFLARSWERRLLSPMRALYLAVESGLESTEQDPGQAAGDTLMTLAVERGIESPQNDLYGLAQHLAAIADLVTWILRPEGPWARPADVNVGNVIWESSAFLSKQGTRLRRIVLVDHWSPERELSESHSWRAMGETSAYQMPMDQTVIVLGQNRAGRRHGPFSKAWTHPVSKDLRFRKRDGSGFDGNWKQVFREDADYSRDKWLDQLTADGVLEDSVLSTVVEIPLEAGAIQQIAEAKLAAIRATETLPDPSLSQCDNPLVPCSYRDACWSFHPPSEQLGFMRIESLCSGKAQ